MQRDSDTVISSNDKAFVIKALKEDRRLDGRTSLDFRKIKFQFSLDDSSATVCLGLTRVMTVVTATLEAPYPERQNEGSMRFYCTLGPIASEAFGSQTAGGKNPELANEITRLLEKALKQSGAIDMEALCVMAGRKVWGLRVDCHVLDHHGNLLDACFLSALAALMAFRRPETSVTGEEGGKVKVVVHPPEVKEPLPLTIQFLPVSVTFGLFEEGNSIAIDPSLREECSMEGSATIMVTPQKEVCAIHKAGGVGLSNAQFLRCMRLACQKSEQVVAQLKKALEVHDVARVQARVRRHRDQGSAASTSVPPTWCTEGSKIVEIAGGVHAAKKEAKEEPAPAAEDLDADMSDGEQKQEEAPNEKSPGSQLKKVAVAAPASAQKAKSKKPAANGAAKKAKTEAPDFNELDAIASMIAGNLEAAANLQPAATKQEGKGKAKNKKNVQP